MGIVGYASFNALFYVASHSTSGVNIGILQDIKNNSEFWKNYSNPIESITKSGYDKFLKFNNISQGIKSYNQSVSLIINYLKR